MRACCASAASRRTALGGELDGARRPGVSSSLEVSPPWREHEVMHSCWGVCGTARCPAGDVLPVSDEGSPAPGGWITAFHLTPGRVLNPHHRRVKIPHRSSRCDGRSNDYPDAATEAGRDENTAARTAFCQPASAGWCGGRRPGAQDKTRDGGSRAARAITSASVPRRRCWSRGRVWRPYRRRLTARRQVMLWSLLMALMREARRSSARPARARPAASRGRALHRGEAGRHRWGPNYERFVRGFIVAPTARLGPARFLHAENVCR